MKSILHRIGHRLNNAPGTAAYVFIFTALSVTLLLWFSSMSQDVKLYRANANAGTEFVSAVHEGWPNDRKLILEKLDAMQSAYLETGEADRAKLKQLDRLHEWAMRTTSVADEQQYLAEVRGHGKVTMNEPFLQSEEALVLSLLLGVMAGLWASICMSDWLKANPLLALTASD